VTDSTPQPVRSATILAVGSELLGVDRLDTNSLRLTATLREHGVALRRKAVVGDDESAIADELRRMVAEAEVVIVTGGLGPTSDDVTREAAAAAFGRALREDREVLAAIEARYRSFARRMPEVNRRQALVIEGATVLVNPQGTAPGQRLEAGGATLFLLPGPPRELEVMISSQLEPWLASRVPQAAGALETWALRVAGVAESEIEERIAPAYAEFGREPITVLASAGDIVLKVTAAGPAAARRARLEAMQRRLAELAGDAVYSWREDEDLETVVGNLLRRRGQTVGVAESCTGGLVAQRLTRIAGSSDYFRGGVVAYANDVKESLALVPAALLREHGAVSEEVALALARGARRQTGSDWGIGITGIAGPGGGSEEKPVGTVYVAIDGEAAGTAATSGPLRHRRLRLPGDRERVRWLSSQFALDLLRRHLLASGREA
jgi:nicotinamide-nucleotide amidase